MRDPLIILTAVVSAALLMVFGRYTVTDELDEKILTGLGAILGALITALSTRKKDGDNNDDDNPS